MRARDGGEREDLGVRIVKLWVPPAEVHSTIMLSDSFPFLPIMTCTVEHVLQHRHS